MRALNNVFVVIIFSLSESTEVSVRGDSIDVVRDEN